MSYVKTTWVTGDIVTAPKLNNLESGVEANDLNKLNKPSGNGTAGQLLISNGDGSTSWTDTDTTLEESGKAADAKAVGDALGEINEALETKAEIDGYYEEMTVGDAEQLVSTVYVEESTPYLYRTTGGSADVGNREYLDKLVGVSVPWNQLVNPTTTTERGITATVNSNGSVTLAGTPTLLNVILWNIAPWVAGHKYLLKEYSSASKWAIYYGNYFRTSATKNGDWRIVQATGSEAASVGISFLSLTEPINDTVEYQLFDLTKMLGTTIADYVYNLETATAGSGVAWLKQYIDLDSYHAYSAPTLKHVEDLQSHDTVGFNQWDEEWEVGGMSSGVPVSGSNQIRSKTFCPIFADTTYYGTCGKTDGGNQNKYYLMISYYDSNKTWINSEAINNLTFTTPTNAAYFKLYTNSSTVVYGNTYNHDICINLSWSGYRNGEYEPYEKHSYALDSSVVLRGVPTLVDGKLVYDGDEYLYDGTINRRYGIVDLGTLDWIYSSSYTVFTANLADAAVEQVNNLVCPLYLSAPGHSSSSPDKTIYTRTVGGVNGIGVKDSAYTDAASFKTAMSGVYLVYKRATPTTETADPYTQVQICDDFGTEQFITSSIIPVGTETRYPANLRDKLQHLPSLAETDGTYLIQQTDKEMSLIPFSGYVTEESLTETLEDYAVVDGYYEGMTVGNAEELVTGLTETESVPFLFRTSGGSLEIGTREEMTVTGGSLAWNQAIADRQHFTNVSTTDTLSYMRLTLRNYTSPFNNYFYLNPPSIGLYTKIFDGGNGTTGTALLHNGETRNVWVWSDTSYNILAGHKYFFTMNILSADPTTVNGVSIDNIQLFDLTQLFGTTIADYIYSLEQATAGAGVAWFKKLFPKDYYPFANPGFVHVNASEFKTVGFNQWDEETEHGYLGISSGHISYISDNNRIRSKNWIPVFPNTTYRYHGGGYGAFVVGCTDENGNGAVQLASNDNADFDFTTGTQTRFVKFACRAGYGGTYKNDVCISIHWDNTRNGEYEPYTEHSYPLDSSLVLRGIPKIDADGNLYYDGDTYEADGTVTRRYGIVDLGTLTWSAQSSNWFCSAGIDALAKRPTSNSQVANMLTSAFTTRSWNDTADKAINIKPIGVSGGNNLWIKDTAYGSAAAFKTAMSGVYLVYELDEAITETADTYQTPQIVDNWGTEQFTVTEQNGVEVPVGHSTIYPISLRDKLEAAPDLPADDGDYILRMSGNEASYARLASEFPTPPTTDGNYVLKATVTNGTATLTWEAQS